MTASPLIGAAELHAALSGAHPPVLLDCGFDLADIGAGERAHAAGHLPGALYAHLDRDLSGPKAAPGPGFTGRHPLPSRAALAATLGRWGIAPGTPVVTYDAQGGPYAARAWWLLRWLGHTEVRVLDGGVAAWRAAGFALDTATPVAHARPPYPAAPEPQMPTLDAAALQAALGRITLLDARAPERFRGDVEPLDSCGSGVTASHNVLAMAAAGLGATRLYPGSWSEWCADPARPVARG
jgi:thiosulfate/3-mercaptopyruvate sulfurtransferase